METQNYLGIYISRGTATAVCLRPQGRSIKILGSFSVSVEDKEKAGPQALAGLIAQACSERKWGFSEVAVALDCAMFMQHSVHSEFNDPKQIAATIRFDTEEALATEITDVALAFEITSTGKSGSELNVFTAQRKILSEVLLSLQQHNFDPVTIEPDVKCLSRFICHKVSSDESQQPGTLFGILSRRNGYLVTTNVSPWESVRTTDAAQQRPSVSRTFLLGSTPNRGDLLAREVLVTTALLRDGESINRLEVFDSSGTLKLELLREKLSIETGSADWLDASGTESQIGADSPKDSAGRRPQVDSRSTGPVDFAIAYGAALTHLEKGQSVNFRDDFSPFQGKKIKRQKALKFASISVTVLLIAVGLYLQTQVFRTNKYRKMFHDSLADEYFAVMLGQELPDNTASAVRKLGGELRRIKDAKKGLITIKGEKSISSKLTLVLKAFNKCAAQTSLNIKSVTITTKDIIITGDTSSRQNTQKFFDTVRSNELEILRPSYESKGGVDGFSIIVAPK